MINFKKIYRKEAYDKFKIKLVVFFFVKYVVKCIYA